MVDVIFTERKLANNKLRIESRTTVKELTDALRGVPESGYLINVVGHDEMPVYLTFYEPVGGV